jgi:hypothetical protein
MSESNTDRYLRARRRLTAAANQKHALATKLQRLSNILLHTRGVGLNEQTLPKGPARSYTHVLDEVEWPLWDEAAATIRNYVKAEDELQAIEANLSDEERALLNLR